MVQDGAFKPSVAAPQQAGTPLRDFSGVLQSYEAQEKTDTQSQRRYVVIQFKFVEVEVYDSTEPYPYPVADIRIGYAPPEQSYGGTRWDAFSASLRKRVPDNPDLDMLVGKRQRWHMAPAPLRQQVDNPDYDPSNEASKPKIWADVMQPSWQIVSIEGVEEPEDLLPYIVSVADGKTEQQLNQALLSDPKITTRPEIVSQITDRTLLPGMLMTNLLTRDPEGILHVPTPTPAVTG